MSLELIARELKATRNAVGTRLHRGRKMLAAQLGKQGVQLSDTMFASALAILVPAAVIRGVMQSVNLSCAPAPVAALPGAVTQMLHMVSALTTRRALRVAVV